MVVYTTIAYVIGQLQENRKKILDYYICRSGIRPFLKTKNRSANRLILPFQFGFFTSNFCFFLLIACCLQPAVTLSQANLIWATYYGGTGTEYANNGIATDASGNIYLAGKTASTSGMASGGFQNTFGG